MGLRSRLRRTGSAPDRFDVPRGSIDAPVDGAAVAGEFVQVLGWALFPGSSVARIDVKLGDAPARRARLGMPRPDVATHTANPAAHVSGFELMAPNEPVGGPVTVSAVAHSADGRQLELGPVTFEAEPPRVAPIDEERASELRDRAARYARPRLARSEGRLRVVAFAHQLPYGGASLWLVEVLKRFAQRPGFECVVVSYQDGPLRDDLESLGIEVHVTDAFPFTTVDQYEGSVCELTAWAAAHRFDVAFVNTLASFQGADLAGRLGLPVVWGVHESFTLPLFWSTAYPSGLLHPYVRGRAEAAFADAAAVVFEAEATRRLFLPSADPERLITLPYGIELDAVWAANASYDRDEVRDALGIDRAARVILCLGTIEPRKSQAMLAEAFASIADRHPDVVLALVGETDAAWCADYTRSLRDFVDRRGLASRIRIEPVVANAHPWHVASDLHVCASDVESLPRSVLEAMAFGVPVVSTRVFGVPELIDDGVTGYLCDTRDAGGLERTLDRALAAGPEERDRITRDAAARVAVRHEPSAYADRLWDLFEALSRDAGADARAVLFAEPAARELAP